MCVRFYAAPRQAAVIDPIAEFAMAAKESGRSYTQMIDAIVKGAMGRRW